MFMVAWLADAQEEKPELGPSLAAGLGGGPALPAPQSFCHGCQFSMCPRYHDGGLGNVVLAGVPPKSRSDL